jgi:hypothetical protein
MGRGFSPLLSAQPQAVPVDRPLRCRRSPPADTVRRTGYPHRRSALSHLPRWHIRRGSDRHPLVLARRPRDLRPRLLVFVRGSPTGGRRAAEIPRAQQCRRCVRDQCRHRPSGAVQGPAGGHHEGLHASRCHPRCSDHIAFPERSRRSSPSRQPREHRRGFEPALFGCRRPGGRRRRATGVLGLRTYSAAGREECETAAVHHPRTRWQR